MTTPTPRAMAASPPAVRPGLTRQLRIPSCDQCRIPRLHFLDRSDDGPILEYVSSVRVGGRRRLVRHHEYRFAQLVGEPREQLPDLDRVNRIEIARRFV